MLSDYACEKGVNLCNSQRRQSGLKSGGVVDPGETISIFSGKFDFRMTLFSQLHLNFHLSRHICHLQPPRQSGLKSGGRGSGSKNFDFLGKFPIFSGNFTNKKK